MSRGCVGGILTVLAFLGMSAILLIIGFNALGIILAIFVGIGICFLDYWIYYGKRSIRESKLTHVICPRCKIPVNKESGICPQCNNRV